MGWMAERAERAQSRGTVHSKAREEGSRFGQGHVTYHRRGVELSYSEVLLL
jgi:hypothetical protein